MSLDLTALKAQLIEGLKELKAADLPAEQDMPFLLFSRWKAVEAEVQVLRMTITELVQEPAKERERQEAKQRAMAKERAA